MPPAEGIAEPDIAAEISATGRVVRRVKEYAPIELPLALLLDDAGELDLHPEVVSTDYFSIHLSEGKVRLQAGGRVGVIPLNDRVAIDVVPRVPVGNLLRLLSLSEHSPEVLPYERSYEQTGPWDESLIDIYAHALASHMENITSSGVYRDYQRRAEITSFPRGRVLLTPTVQRLRTRGIKHKVAAGWFEHSADNAPNRCLKYALWFVSRRLHQIGATSAARRRLLTRLGVVFEVLRDVRLDHRLTFLSDPMVEGRTGFPSLRSYYRPAMSLAVAIIRQHGIKIEGQAEGIGMPSLVLNMNDIFENYLRNVLQSQGRTREWAVEVLDGNSEGKKLLLDSEPSENATPDIVLRNPTDQSFPIILEVKNVPVGNQSKRSHIEQVVTYGASYRSGCLILVHPRGCGDLSEGLELQGTIGGMDLHKFTYDLAADSLSDGEVAFADAIEGLLVNPTNAVA